MQTQEIAKKAKTKIPVKKLASKAKEVAASVVPDKALASSTPDLALAAALGIFSLALGAAEVIRTQRTARVSGIDKKYLPVLQLFGAREIISGIGLLASKDKKKWLVSRVVGDALDAAFLGYAYWGERRPDSRKKILKAFLTISPIVLADIYAVTRARRA